MNFVCPKCNGLLNGANYVLDREACSCEYQTTTSSSDAASLLRNLVLKNLENERPITLRQNLPLNSKEIIETVQEAISEWRAGAMTAEQCCWCIAMFVEPQPPPGEREREIAKWIEKVEKDKVYRKSLSFFRHQDGQEQK